MSLLTTNELASLLEKSKKDLLDGFHLKANSSLNKEYFNNDTLDNALKDIIAYSSNVLSENKSWDIELLTDKNKGILSSLMGSVNETIKPLVEKGKLTNESLATVVSQSIVSVLETSLKLSSEVNNLNSNKKEAYFKDLREGIEIASKQLNNIKDGLDNTSAESEIRRKEDLHPETKNTVIKNNAKIVAETDLLGEQKSLLRAQSDLYKAQSRALNNKQKSSSSSNAPVSRYSVADTYGLGSARSDGEFGSAGISAIKQALSDVHSKEKECKLFSRSQTTYLETAYAKGAPTAGAGASTFDNIKTNIAETWVDSFTSFSLDKYLWIDYLNADKRKTYGNAPVDNKDFSTTRYGFPSPSAIYFYPDVPHAYCDFLNAFIASYDNIYKTIYDALVKVSSSGSTTDIDIIINHLTDSPYSNIDNIKNTDLFSDKFKLIVSNFGINISCSDSSWIETTATVSLSKTFIPPAVPNQAKVVFPSYLLQDVFAINLYETLISIKNEALYYYSNK